MRSASVHHLIFLIIAAVSHTTRQSRMTEAALHHLCTGLHTLSMLLLPALAKRSLPHCNPRQHICRTALHTLSGCLPTTTTDCQSAALLELVDVAPCNVDGVIQPNTWTLLGKGNVTFKARWLCDLDAIWIG